MSTSAILQNPFEFSASAETPAAAIDPGLECRIAATGSQRSLQQVLDNVAADLAMAIAASPHRLRAPD